MLVRRNRLRTPQDQLVRRIVRDFVHTAIARAKPALEQYIDQHLRYPEPFPFTLTDTVAALHELQSVQVTPRFPADYPLVDVTIMVRDLLTAETRRCDEELGATAHVCRGCRGASPWDGTGGWVRNTPSGGAPHGMAGLSACAAGRVVNSGYPLGRAIFALGPARPSEAQI